ncbi:MAG TPA: hypothetical protein VMA30_07010 [Xanthobacteraceae bacterium]|nr:hypothetical protein [Xanthobacteraceae bacterium]
MLVLLLAPYYTGASVNTLKNQQAAQAAVDRAQTSLQQARQSGSDAEAKQALEKAQAALDDARQRLDALKHQLDQLSAQNNRLTALDDQQQRQIAELQQQAAQTTKQALDRAEQTLAAADKAVQTGDIETLKRLLAQARADLAEARKQLDALQRQLNETQTALRQARDQVAALQRRLDEAQAALAQAHDRIADLEAKLAEAQAAEQEAERERDQARQERNDARARADAEKQTLAEAAALPTSWLLLDFKAAPGCAAEFQLRTDDTIETAPQYSGFDSAQDRSAFLDRSVQQVTFAPLGTPAGFNPAQPYRALYMIPVVQGVRFLIGLTPIKLPPERPSDKNSSAPIQQFFSSLAAGRTEGGCAIAFGFSWTQKLPNGASKALWTSRTSPVEISGTHPVLFLSFPPRDMQHPYALAPEEVAQWKKATGDGVGPTDAAIQPSTQPQPPAARAPFGPPVESHGTTGQEKH